jgi:Family of unknown function (DUF6804)
MLINVIRWSAIAALIGGAFLRSAADYPLILQFVVMTASVIVLTQAAIMRRYVWMILFLLVAALFNPVFPVSFSSHISAMVSTFALFLFFFSLGLLKPDPNVSVTAIKDRMPEHRRTPGSPG